jgi:hypothetical protein
MFGDGSKACKTKEDKLMALVKFASLWKRDEKEGYSGKLEDGRSVLLVKNQYKKGDKEPDLRLLLITDDEAPKNMPPVQDDDIPF